MIHRLLVPTALVLSLAACSGNPLNNVDDGTDGGTGGGTDGGTGGIGSDGRLPPGTTNPNPVNDIVRYEARDSSGNGYARGIIYDSDTDTFTVDGLAFDGANNYRRGTRVGSLGPFAVYEGPNTAIDNVDGEPIGQFVHRAIYAVSPTGQTEFAIVRTGSYIPYGFGGYVYQRNGNVTLPTSGQVRYNGNYAGLRDFNGRGGIEYARGDMTMDIDFNDFDEGSGVAGYVYNRRIFDVNGNDITNNIISAINAENSASLSALPTLVFTVGPGVLDANGEIAGRITSSYTNDRGRPVSFEEGNYYAVVAGDNAEEVAGIIVVEGPDDRAQGVTVRETGGFILYNNPPAP